MKQRFINGSDIVSTRSWRIAELFDAFFNHSLGCYRPHSVEKEYSGQSCITCAEDRPLFGVPPDSECFYGRRGCGGPYEVNYETILERLVECDFDFEDIEKYEKAHGIRQAASSATGDVFSHPGTSQTGQRESHMRLHEKWPKGHGVDREFWGKQKLWHLSDAAAISLGVDPRVCYCDAGTKDPALHGGPKLAENQVPGLVSEIENLVIMAMNARLPVLKDGVTESEDKAWWRIRPADYWAAIGKEQAASSATDDVFLHLGTSPDDLEPSITGEEIIERWKGSRANLFKALRDGDLVPVDQIPLRGEECTKRHTKELDPCLYCESPSLDKICKLHNEEHKCHHKDDSVRIDRVNISSFLLREVLEYEEKVLASPGDAGPDAPKVYSMPPISSGCIKGEELLTRWRAIPFQLVAAWKNGLGTVRAVDGARQVHGRSCLECWGCDSNGFPSCNRNYAYCDRAECDGCRCLCARGETTGGVDVATLGARLRESSFILEEVEDYERLNLLGPEKKRLEFSPTARKKKVYVQVELGEPFSSKNAPHQPSPHHSHHAAEAPAETLLPTGITETAMPGQDLPDNPLDYGKEMVKMGYKGAERIRRMEERFPYLNTAQVGAYARGLPPGEKNEGACKQWYQRNKPD